MIKERKIELLSPARDKFCAKAGINAGADAIYIGGPAFGARSAASNSIADIDEICQYARRFGVKVYVTLNTTLRDEETEEARRMAWQVYEAGADALIVQDYGLLEMDLPPLELHSSTQMDTRTLEKAKWLSEIGFQQIVLARELGLSDIKRITESVSAKIEVFVHGALCVCYSGQCYLSEYLTGRSANRGTCSQPCRMSWDLVCEDQETGRTETLERRKYLLSLRDMNRSGAIGDLIEAGVSSFKIEGRLKDEGYVKNITAYYRRRIDECLEAGGGNKASWGTTKCLFEPDVERTFYRGGTDYFLYSKKKDGIASTETPKSIGKKIGVVEREMKKGEWLVRLNKGGGEQISLHNGDGICFKSGTGEWRGGRIEKVIESNMGNESVRVLMNRDLEWVESMTGKVLFRNLDVEFEKRLLSENIVVRKIAVDMTLEETSEGYELSVRDEMNNCVHEALNMECQVAKNEEMARCSIEETLRKTGDTIFEVRTVRLKTGRSVPFVPKSILAEKRRIVLSRLEEEREKLWGKKRKASKKTGINVIPLPQGMDCHFDDYRANVTNELARRFLERCGAEMIREKKEMELMRCRHCVKYLVGKCGDERGAYFLEHGKDRLRLMFDCEHCEMVILRS